MRDGDPLFAALEALRDELPRLMLVGGWVPQLYFDYVVGWPERRPLLTEDVDMAIARSGARGKDLADLLEREGFEPVFKSLDTPPVVAYRGPRGGAQAEVEFITVKRSGRDPVSVNVLGIQAQPLSYVDVLLANPLRLRIPGDDLPSRRGLDVTVPAPAAFVFHKCLVFPRRRDRVKRGKDLYSVFDVVDTFMAKEPNRTRFLDELGELAGAWPGRFRRAVRVLEDHFADVDSEGVRLVEEQRPADAFPGLPGAQFRLYVLGVFRSLLEAITPSRR